VVEAVVVKTMVALVKMVVALAMAQVIQPLLWDLQILAAAVVEHKAAVLALYFYLCLLLITQAYLLEAQL
jgi:hypothetical protein